MRMRKKIPLADAEINLTPLIDVVFVILIMFIIVAPLLEADRIELAGGPSLDKHPEFAVQEKSAIAIHVYSDDTLAVNQRPLSLSQLKDVLVAAHQKFPTSRPQVFQDRHATFGIYQAIKNAIEAAGFDEMDVILKPE